MSTISVRKYWSYSLPIPGVGVIDHCTYLFTCLLYVCLSLLVCIGVVPSARINNK